MWESGRGARERKDLVRCAARELILEAAGAADADMGPITEIQHYFSMQRRSTET